MPEYKPSAENEADAPGICGTDPLVSMIVTKTKDLLFLSSPESFE